MRLADFILANEEPILVQWENFAQRIWPEENASVEVFRDDAKWMLESVARDMKTAQSESQQEPP